ncbi:MAG: type II toxin-antitoxin system RelE/ParE family toxin [Acidiferrobacterales bacterium]
MSCFVRIRASAAKALARMNRPDRARLIAAIDALADRPHAGTPLKGEHRGLRRIRAGSYRFIYEVMEREIVGLVVSKGQRAGL